MGREEQVMRNAMGIVLVLAALAALLLVLGLLGPYLHGGLAGRLGADALRYWNEPYFEIGGVGISAAFLLKALAFLVLLTFVSRVTRHSLRRKLLDRTALDEGQKFALERGTGYLVFTLGLVIGVRSIGVNLDSLAFLGGAVGIGVGFGLQAIANNFLSGLILLVERPIKVGDRIEIGNLNGDVDHIAARSTWIRTNDNIVIIVPNSEFITGRVTNWTANDRSIRFALPVGVSYSSDPENVRELLLEVAQEHPDVLADPAPDVRFVGFGNSSLDFELRVWTTRQVRTPQVLRSDLYFTIFRSFREHGIEIPFPQRDLHIRSVAQPIPLDIGPGIPKSDDRH
jgi:small-conductance mechanosensitive channel